MRQVPGALAAAYCADASLAVIVTGQAAGAVPQRQEVGEVPMLPMKGNSLLKSWTGLIAACCLALAGGCATQKPVALSMDALTAKPARVGVVLAQVPTPDTLFPGANCLLCLAAASVANSALTIHANKLPTDELAGLPRQIAQLLRARGIDAKAIDERVAVKELPRSSGSGPDIASKDFRALGSKYGVEQMVVLEVALLGFERSYSSYIPNGDPKGFLVGTGYLIDLTSNTYRWYAPIHVTKSADGNWDEPPSFPGLTNAYYQAIELGKDQWLAPFTAK